MQEVHTATLYYVMPPGSNILLCKGSIPQHFTKQRLPEARFYYARVRTATFYFARAASKNVLLCKGSSQEHVTMQRVHTATFYYARGPGSNIF